VNGDGYRDFLVHWYPVSGCCGRDIYEVFVYLPATGSFSEGLSFINPVFYPKSHLIRGLGYGHLQEVEVYTYQWKGAAIDTIEYIYPWLGHRGKFIKTVQEVGRASPEDGVVLHRFPEAYRDVRGVIWYDEQ
jgi:hypothetical protein